MRIPNEVLAVLDRCDTQGCRLTLPSQLERGDYVRVNTVIEAAGGKWDKRAKAHLFTDPAGPIIETIMLTGEVVSRKQELQYFPTPPLVVAEMLDRAALEPGMSVLEPSAGRGAIAQAASEAVGWGDVDCIELDGANVNALRELRCARAILTGDFLAVPVDQAYDRVLMNPPFTAQQDIAHVTRALEWLKPGGLLVSVMALGVTFRQNKAAADFRALVAARDGYIDGLPDDAFKESGTGVKTVIVTIPGERDVIGYLSVFAVLTAGAFTLIMRELRRMPSGFPSLDAGERYEALAPPESAPRAVVIASWHETKVQYYARLAREQQAAWRAETADRVVRASAAVAAEAARWTHLDVDWHDATDSFRALCGIEAA